MMTKTLLISSLAAILTAPLHAGDWPQFRGPNFNGSAAADEADLPEKFSRESGVKWAADLPGPAASTPVVWGDKVFLTSTNLDTQDLEAICFDRKSGEVLWTRAVGIGMKQDDRSNFASNSPATDGERVVFFFGTGDLAAFDLDGKELWKRNIQKDYGEFAFLWTFSTSPLLYNNKLYLQVLQRDTAVNGRGKKTGNESYLLAMDPATGEELWKVNRPADAKKESLEAFTTPTPFRGAGRDELIIAGGDCLTGHNPETGAELWRWGTWNPKRITHWRLVPSPVVGGGVILGCAPKGSPVYAVKAGATGSAELAWKSDGKVASSDVSTPLFYDGKFYVLDSDRKALACIDPATGNVVWREELEGRSKFEASPTGADGKIYLVNHDGEVYVVKAGDKFELLNKADFGDKDSNTVRSTIVAAHGNLFIRTGSKLYCIGE